MSLQREHMLMPIAEHGDHTVTVSTLLAELKFQSSWHIVTNAVLRELTRSCFKEYEIEVSEDEVSAFMDQFRTEKDLYSVEELSDWLSTNQLADDEFDQFCQFEASLIAL